MRAEDIYLLKIKLIKRKIVQNYFSNYDFLVNYYYVCKAGLLSLVLFVKRILCIFNSFI